VNESIEQLRREEKRGVKIGVISDTHNFLDPRVSSLFEGVSHILHAGDIGQPRVLLELEQIAPVTAVAGNTDETGFNYPETETVELAGLKFLLHHIVAPQNLSEVVQRGITRERPDVVVFGHTHKPFAQRIGAILYFNPGYAGKTRFGMERSVAVLQSGPDGVTWEYSTL
jgi:putative phosphoesterase